MSPPTPESSELGLDPEAQRVDVLAREILGDNYFHFQIESAELKEDMASGGVRLDCKLIRTGSGQEIKLSGEGVGLIDAFFEGVMQVFAAEYPSLKTIKVSDFNVGAGMADAKKDRASDALAHANLRIKNSAGEEFTFTSATPSVTRSSVRVALDALTFFINSERAYVQLHLALKDARERRRSDLVQKYRGQMATLVHATSYSEVIEKLRAEDGDS